MKPSDWTPQFPVLVTHRAGSPQSTMLQRLDEEPHRPRPIVRRAATSTRPTSTTTRRRASSTSREDDPNVHGRPDLPGQPRPSRRTGGRHDAGASCLLLVALLAAAVAARSAACTSFRPERRHRGVGPGLRPVQGRVVPTGGCSTGVEPVLERACGTLDCHGQVGRPLRIYGQYGLRFVDPDAATRPGHAGHDRDRARGQLPGRHRPSAGADDRGRPGQRSRPRRDPPAQAAAARAPQGRPVLVEGDDAYNCIMSWLAEGGPTTSSLRLGRREWRRLTSSRPDRALQCSAK